MADQHKPGETSGIYKVVKDGDGDSGFEGICVEGEHFPPTRSGKGAPYELVHGATHSQSTANSAAAKSVGVNSELFVATLASQPGRRC